MNVRIFWVRAMKCMCPQTRPRFILSSEGVFGGMEFEPMLTQREKSPLPKVSPEEDRTHDAVDSEPKHYHLSYSGPHTQVSSPVTMSQLRGDLHPSNFLSMWVHQSTPPHFFSSLRLWGTQQAQLFLTPRQLWRMQMRLSDEIFMASGISAYVIFGSFSIRDSTLETFSGVTVVAMRPQRS